MVKITEFDADKVEPIGKFEPIPIGEYVAIITKTEQRPSKKNPANQYVQVDFKVIDGPYKNRVIFDFLNLVNENEKAVEIAQRKLSGIIRAVGLHKIQDTDELVNRPLVLSLGIRKGTDGYDDQNDIKEYKTASGAPIPATNSTSQPSGTSTPTQKMPWER